MTFYDTGGSAYGLAKVLRTATARVPSDAEEGTK